MDYVIGWLPGGSTVIPKIPIKEICIRIDDIPTNHSHDMVQRFIASIIASEPQLRDEVTETVHHFMVRRDRNIFCATVTFQTTIFSAGNLVARLQRAGTALPYSFDAGFRGLTPLYECPSGAHVE